MTDHPEFPDQTSESYLAPRYRLEELAKENERLRAEIATVRSFHEVEAELKEQAQAERDMARAELARLQEIESFAKAYVQHYGGKELEMLEMALSGTVVVG